MCKIFVHTLLNIFLILCILIFIFNNVTELDYAYYRRSFKYHMEFTDCINRAELLVIFKRFGKEIHIIYNQIIEKIFM